VGIRDKLRRLERLAEGEMVVIPQVDGTVATFPQSTARDAMANFFDRLGAGEDAPPEHPLIEAARNSSDQQWTESFFAVNDPDNWIEPIEDLSEP
jgi:hypothetical protein